MCRAVRKGGNGSLLWPQGCTSVEEVPVELVRAVEHAFKILDWYENLMKDEMPPRWMWHLDHELEPWFEEVERAREERFGVGSDSDDIVGPTMQNEYAEELRRR